MSAVCVSIFLYADDILLTVLSISGLQTLVNICEMELTNIGMSINAKKSFCIQSGPRFNPVWPVEAVSVYRQHVRTNNDVEGWHRRLNHQARRANLPFYVLVRLLYAEASVDIRKRNIPSLIVSRLWELWDRYSSGATSTSRLLRSATRLQLPNWMAEQANTDLLVSRLTERRPNYGYA